MIFTKTALLESVRGYLEEMAYPTDFDMNAFKNIRSFDGKIKYARQMLLGKIGAGTGRAVFRIDNEKVMKVALNARGVQQNSVEAEGYKQNYDVVARVFDIDDDYAWIEMELAKKVTPARFRQLTGTTPEYLGKWLQHRIGRGAFGTIPDLDENEFAEELANFAGDYQYPAPGDFRRISSYGEVLRDGVPKIVVIDFGYDSDTEIFYTSKLKAKHSQRY